MDTLTVDGVTTTPLISYTFTNVTANHTISVTFKVDPNYNLLAFYKFDETSGTTAADSSGHGHAGTTNSGCGWVAGHINNSIAFDGSTGSMSIPTLGSSIAAFTIAGWINVHNLPSGSGWQAASVMSSDGWSAGDLAMLLLGPNSGTHAGQLQVSVAGAPGNDLVWSAFNFNSSLNTWVHFAATYSSSGAKVYINGTQNATASFSTSQTADFSALKVGSWGGGSRFFDGQLDHLMIYSKVLSATEITNMYNGTVNITASAGTGGSISPTGSVAVNFSADQTFTITPSASYVIANVLVDGVSQGAVRSYTFYGVTASHTISATFTKAVGMNNKSVLTDTRAPGRAVVVWGKVKSINGTTSFVISDGSNATGVTVLVSGVALPTGFDTTKTAIVTGSVASDRKIQAQAIRAVP